MLVVWILSCMAQPHRILRHVPQKDADVKTFALTMPLELTNDSALADAHVFVGEMPVMPKDSILLNCTGRGVVIGMIDTGVDFNHINLCDSTGKSRVVSVYLPHDTTGVHPSIDGDTLQGSFYETPAQIARLTTDTPNESHGTHTTGTAAGSFRLNGYGGVAPEAHIVVCAMPTLYDDEIAQSVRYIFDYATRKGMPAVVNMSLGATDGPHDGSSPLCQLFDSISGQGRILVVSAHNTGSYRMHLPYSFRNETDTLRTTIERYASTFSGYASLWSSPGHHHRVEVTLMDIKNKRQILSIPLSGYDVDADSVVTLSLDADSLWSKYMTGNLYFGEQIERGDRTHSVLEIAAKPLDATQYRLGLNVTSNDSDPNFNLWVGETLRLMAYGAGQTAGVNEGSINDLATGDKAISVGAYISRQSVPQLNGEPLYYNRAKPVGDIAYFSAWGPDARGIARPDICAPGMVLVSSASRYDSVSSIATKNCVLIQEANGEKYPYGPCYGTSMSAPVVSGAIALMLQLNPYLSPEEIRQAFDQTAITDEFVLSPANSQRWGRGKLDVMATLRYVRNHLNRHDINKDGAVDVSDVNMLINILLGKSPKVDYSDVNGDGMIDVADINSIINEIMSNS